jgi:RNA polymerase sigma factor (TIGR02999 family)
MPQSSGGDVTQLLRQWRQGDAQALRQVFPLVYQQLRRLARRELQVERAQHSIQSTALVHEAFLRLIGARPADLQDRAHFLAVASRAMRQILVDLARGRNAEKRDWGLRVEYADVPSLPVKRDADLFALDDALSDLSRIDERQAQIVEMRFFGGLSSPEISEVLGVSRATVDRDWATARVWLHRQLTRLS